MNTDYEIYELSDTQWKKFCITAYPIIVLLCLLFYRNLIFALACGFAVVLMKDKYAAYMAKKQKTLLMMQFRDMLVSVSASISTGRQMIEAMAEALERLRSVYREDSPLVRELDVIVRGVRESRDREEEMLRSFANRSRLEDIENFADVYIICRVTGGNMQNAVNRAVEVICEKMDIERDIKTQTVQRQYEGMIITAIPVVVLLMLNIFSPDYVEPLYETVQGRIVMTLGLAGILAAWEMSIRLMDIEV